MTTYLSEAFTGSNGASWNASNWTNLISTSGASATIQSNKGRQNAGSATGYSGKRADRWNGATHADYEFIGKVTFVNSVDGHAEIWLRASTTAYDGTGYLCSINVGTTNNITVTKAVSYTYTTLGSASVTVTQGTTYGFRFYVVGTTIKAKVWDASGSEPGSYNLTYTDSAVAAAGYAYLGTNGGSAANMQIDWDDITLTDGTGNALTFTGTVTSTGSLLKSTITKLPFTGSTTAVGVLTKLKVVVKSFTGSITPIGAFIKVPQKVLTGSVTTTGASVKRLFRIYTGTTTGVGTFRKASVRSFTGSITPVGTFVETFLGRIFGTPGVARVAVVRAAQAIIRIRRT
jgi:hypothetical protein